MTDTSTNFDPTMQQTTGQAAHLMWLQRQLQTQRKNERAMQLAFGLSVVFDVIVLVALFTFLRDLFELPEIVTIVVIGGLVLEMALLAYFVQRVSKRRRELEQEIDMITNGYTQS
jgi:hypothetical protein